ncbi:hypothetical protein EVJ58_g4242 [Rhodofomes roseus]|uniref:N-acetyltransferase domain-containing protein n=1 Tax=Rhodofomes roseus TaxID=34475 RepID=A0A4Y9YH26_9APHY|nr:hypothetical protein EVJ58_g4242 [Rhodofomes roseus]
MSPPYVNNYAPPKTNAYPDPEVVLNSKEPYDINFSFPLHLDTLACPTVRLTPFVPTLHARTLWEHIGSRARELFRYYPYCPDTFAHFLSVVENIRGHPDNCAFAIFDRTRKSDGGDTAAEDGVLAGVMALINTNKPHMNTEIGLVVVFPAFQGTHVARTSAGLLLRYCLQTPAASPPGLGFRRVRWSAHTHNKPSLGLAKRMGFREEGILRWSFVIPDVEEMKREAHALKREGEEGWGRDSVCLSICWDDWDDGAASAVGRLLQ